MMLRHYLTVAIRDIARQPVTTGVGVLTLALGLVCMLSAFALSDYWANSDSQFANADRTYVVTASLDIDEQNIHTGTWPHTNPHYAKYVLADVPELTAVARTVMAWDVSISAGERGIYGTRVLADPEFAEIIDLPYVSGDPATALARPRSVVLTEPTAASLFGDADPVGRTVKLASQIEATVTGVIREIPEPSHLSRVSFFGSWDIWDEIRRLRQADGFALFEESEDWFSNYCCTTYLLLPEDGSLSPEELNAVLEGFPARRISAEELSRYRIEVGAIPLNEYWTTILDGMLFGQVSDSLSVTGVLFTLGSLILLVACINYANLASARAMRRSRDVGLRKVVGATRSQVAAQYLFESGLLVGAGLVIAMLVMMAMLPALGSSLQMDLMASPLFSSASLYVFAGALLAVVTIAAGAYPAFVLARTRPVEALRMGTLHGGRRFSASLLVGGQFVAASFLLIMVIVMYVQSAEIRRNGLGVIEDPLLVIDNASALTGVSAETLRAELLALPQFRAVTSAVLPPWYGSGSLSVISRDENPIETGRSVLMNWVGHNFFDVFEIPLLAGRLFDPDRADDVMPPMDQRSASRVINIVIDDVFANELGFESPAAAVGETLYWPHGTFSDPGFTQPLRVIGVVESRPLQLSSIGAAGSYFALSEDLEYVIARIDGSDVPAALAAVDELWERLTPAMPRSTRFLDEVFEENYRLFGRIHQLFTVLALMAVFISMVGLLGMAAHAANRRRHEIGVRKSVGASTQQIVRMLLKDFAKPVVIANIATWPLAFLAASAYLSVFVFRISLTPLPFVLSLTVTALVAWIAVAGQALRASRVRPVEVLGCE